MPLAEASGDGDTASSGLLDHLVEDDDAPADYSAGLRWQGMEVSSRTTPSQPRIELLLGLCVVGCLLYVSLSAHVTVTVWSLTRSTLRWMPPTYARNSGGTTRPALIQTCTHV